MKLNARSFLRKHDIIDMVLDELSELIPNADRSTSIPREFVEQIAQSVELKYKVDLGPRSYFSTVDDMVSALQYGFIIEQINKAIKPFNMVFSPKESLFENVPKEHLWLKRLQLETAVCNSFWITSDEVNQKLRKQATIMGIAHVVKPFLIKN